MWHCHSHMHVQARDACEDPLILSCMTLCSIHAGWRMGLFGVLWGPPTYV